LFGAVAAACVWFTAFTIESAARLMAGLFAQFGADLPLPTRLTIDAVQNYLPWMFAAVSTLLVVYLGVRASAYFVYACIVVAAVTAVLASIVALALVLPIMKCGVAWPEWPNAAIQTPHQAGKPPAAKLTPDTPVNPRMGSCT
jgi:hypothetical protein